MSVTKTQRLDWALVVSALFMAGCYHDNGPRVPKARLPYERPLVQIQLPRVALAKGAYGLSEEGDTAKFEIKNGTDVQFQLEMVGDIDSAPHLLSVTASDARNKTKGAAGMYRAKTASNAVQFKSDSLTFLESGRYVLKVIEIPRESSTRASVLSRPSELTTVVQVQVSVVPTLVSQ